MRLLTWAFFASLSLILMLQLRGFDEPLRTPDTPRGIVDYELAWTATRATAVIDAWRQGDAIETAKVRLGIDFAFLLAYPLMFASGIALLRHTPPVGRLDRLGAIVRRAVLLCIPLDAAENVLLWRMLDHGATETGALAAAIFAVLKFLLVASAILWCIAAIIRRLISRRPAQAA